MNKNKEKHVGTGNEETVQLDDFIVRFSGDSGDGMQLAGNIFSTVSAIAGNDICTFPNYPADIRAPQGTRSGVSAFQVHVGKKTVYTPGDKCDLLVAMNAAALATQYKFCKPEGAIIIDTDCFKESDLKKAEYSTDDPITELGIKNEIIGVSITSIVKDCLADSGMDNKSILKCRNMFALGLVCWLLDSNMEAATNSHATPPWPTPISKFSKRDTISEVTFTPR